MNYLLRNKLIIVAFVSAFHFGLANSLLAGAMENNTSASAEKKVEETTQDQTAEKRKQIYSEATEAISSTQNALKLLDKKKQKEALKALESATGKLELILAREPKLALAPSHVTAVTHEVRGDIDTVKALREQAEEALTSGRLQEARRLLQPLASETVVRVTNIPLASYPAAIKEAARFIDTNKAEEAKRVLQTALNTLVITDRVIPLPILTAEQLIKDSEAISEKKDRTPEDTKRLAELLTAVRSKLELAEALGYGGKSDFKNLYAQLGEIEKKTEKGKAGSGFFAKIRSSLSELARMYEAAANKQEPSAAKKEEPAKRSG